ncbi:MAG TPA: hypothetical protein VEN81_01410 [Planctomycetota bacterium]|nr:hypothetical protein [Planctomycetota bacterium]
MAKTLEVPFSHGDVIAITGTGTKVILWMKDANSVVRGLLLDITDPANPTVGKDEIIVRRKTEGQVRKKKLPPVGNPLPGTAAPPVR